MSYSSEFREFVVKKIHEGMSRSEAETFFKVSRDSIYRWLKKYEGTGNLSDPPRKPYTPRKIDSARLIAEIERNPDATLHELAEIFDCWPHAIFRRCKKLGITRKKNHSLRGAGRKKA